MEGIIVLNQGVEMGRKKSRKDISDQLINSEALQQGEINIKIKEDNSADKIDVNNSINAGTKFKNIIENNKNLINININTLLNKNTILERKKTINDIPKGSIGEITEEELSIIKQIKFFI